MKPAALSDQRSDSLVEPRPVGRYRLTMPVTLGRVLARRPLPPDGAVITVESDGHAGLQPFQFYMLSVPGDPGFPYIPRPFSVYDAGEKSLDFLLKVVGPGTESLANVPLGGEVQLAGPLGLGITSFATERRPVGVAGGVGIAPFLLLYRQWVAGLVGPPDVRPLLVYGARSAEFLYDLELFRQLPVEVRVCTDDGSAGVHGRVTDVLAEVLDEGPADVLACGPDPMMIAVANLCAARTTACRLSLETYMACGFGVCNACAVKVKDDQYRDGYRFDRCCVDGPVFDAAKIDVSSLSH